jgi:hypothetical protein
LNFILIFLKKTVAAEERIIATATATISPEIQNAVDMEEGDNGQVIYP